MRHDFLTRQNAGALLLGALCLFGFAPFGQFWLPLLAQGGLFWLWYRADTPRLAAQHGFAFGLGLFCAGVSWIYVSLHDYGDMPMLLAAGATLAFSAFLALFTALAGYAQARLPLGREARLLWVMPVSWVFIEWFRGMFLTGFPWLTLGYVHSDSPLAGYAPLLGVYGVSLLAALSVAWLLAVVQRRESWRWLALLGVLALWGGGAVLRQVEWTQPEGAPFSVALIQGNVPQERKFRHEERDITLLWYLHAVEASTARLTVLPESAFPMFRDEVPSVVVRDLQAAARRNGGDVLIGAFEEDRRGYFNSVFTLGSAREQRYDKQHLVVFGEFIPLRPIFGWLINEVLHIPMGDLGRGADNQPPLQVAGQRVAVSICYEDVFGEEIIRALPAASVLVNVTNDGWFGNSPAAAQHNQMAQFRALETGRMLLRATNTGMTSLIGPHGQVLQQLPPHQSGTLRGMAQGYRGSTPYVRWGNAAVWLMWSLMLLLAWGHERHTRRAFFA